MTLGASLNELPSLATGDVLLFIHADTLGPPSAASAIWSALEEPSVVGGAFRLRRDDPGQVTCLVAQSVNLRTTLLNTFSGDQAMFVQHEVFARLERTSAGRIAVFATVRALTLLFGTIVARVMIDTRTAPATDSGLRAAVSQTL